MRVYPLQTAPVNINFRFPRGFLQDIGSKRSLNSSLASRQNSDFGHFLLGGTPGRVGRYPSSTVGVGRYLGSTTSRDIGPDGTFNELRPKMAKVIVLARR